MDILSPFISVLCHSDSCHSDVVHPGCAWSFSSALHYTDLTVDGNIHDANAVESPVDSDCFLTSAAITSSDVSRTVPVRAHDTVADGIIVDVLYATAT